MPPADLHPAWYRLPRSFTSATTGSYILSFNGGKIINCSTGEAIYNKILPSKVTSAVYEIASQYDVDLLTYTEHEILSGIKPNQYTELESKINNMPIVRVENFPEAVTFPVNKFLITGEAALTEKIETLLKEKFHSLLNIYRSEPFFLEVMPQNIDKAHSLQKLLNYLGMSADQMICCGDGFNDLTMIEYAGLGSCDGKRTAYLEKDSRLYYEIQ